MAFSIPNFFKTFKAVLLTSLLCALALPAFATHLMGGELIVTHLSGNSYVLSLTLYRDASPGTAGLPSAEPYNYYPTDANGLPDMSLRLSRTLRRDASLNTPLVSNSPYPIEVGVYTDTIQLSGGRYWFTMTDGNRNGAILNMNTPGSLGIGLVTEFTVPATGANSSPRFLTNPVPFFFVNAAANYNPLPYDPDGDSLVWSLNVPKNDVTWISGTTTFGSNVSGFTTPPGSAANPFTMNAFSGNISWTPNTLGNFVQSFQIDEYRNGIKIGSVIRDYQYIVIAGDTTALPTMQRSANIQYDAANRYYYLYYTPGQPLSFSVTGSVGMTLDALLMKAYSELLEGPNPQAQFTSTASGSLAVVGTIQWTPPANYSRTVPVVIRQQNGYVFNDFTVLMKRASTPAGVAHTNPELTANLYPNPTTGRFSVALTLPTATPLTAIVLNPMGQQVTQLHDGVAQGQVTIHCNQQLPQGLYFVRLQTTSGTTVLPLTIR